MENEEWLAIEFICENLRIDVTFIQDLNERGLIEILVSEHKSYLLKTQIGELEKIIRLHQELEINLAGIEVISNLLGQITNLKEEVRRLNTKIQRLENE